MACQTRSSHLSGRTALPAVVWFKRNYAAASNVSTPLRCHTRRPEAITNRVYILHARSSDTQASNHDIVSRGKRFWSVGHAI